MTDTLINVVVILGLVAGLAVPITTPVADTPDPPDLPGGSDESA